MNRGMNLESALTALVPLNAWARCDYEQALGMDRARQAVYAMKRRVISAALDQGTCKLRVVQVERPCKTCKETGTYEWHDWHDEYNVDYQACRRCGATGKVKLRFLESDICGVKWHTPSNRLEPAYLSTLKLDWNRPEDTDWTPEQPARILERVELIGLLNAAERVVFEGKLLRWHNGWRGSVHEYSLHLGYYNHCFVCGREYVITRWSFGREIFRPGLKWEQRVCDECESRASRWPRQWPANLYAWGQWITEHPRWAMCCPLPDLAHSWDVTEWLARRGIVIGRIPPTEHGYWKDAFVEVAAHRNGSSVIRVIDSKHFLHSGYGDDARLLTVPAQDVRSRQPKLLGV